MATMVTGTSTGPAPADPSSSSERPREPVTGRLAALLRRWRLALVCAGFVVLAMLQEPGKILGDTKSDLVVDPLAFLGRARSLGFSIEECRSLLALRDDGSVWAWGQNAYGQLGTGSTTASAVPVRVPGLPRMVALAAGPSFSVALDETGAVWTWGDNATGQLGDGTQTARVSPVKLTSVPDVLASVSVRGGHVLARSTQGTAWTWGRNATGQLGNGTLVQETSPRRVPGFVSVEEVAASGRTSYARRSDGSVWSWGDNAAGQLGTGVSTLSTVPVAVLGQPRRVPLASGDNHVLAAFSDGALWSWGQNGSGQLGVAGTGSPESPRYVAQPKCIEAVAAGAAFSVALRCDGTVWAWGDNGSGQLGVEPTTLAQRTEPAQVPGLSNVVAIAAGASHVLALRVDGTVWAWGANGAGQLGAGGSSASRAAPAPVRELLDTVSIAAGAGHSLAVRADGTVWAWGQNASGQLGDGTFTSRDTPGVVSAAPRLQSLVAGARHSLGLTAAGAVWAWGDNTSGQLGEGSAVSARPSPVQVQGLSGVTFLAAGAGHSLARSASGVWTWGQNGAGQLGDGTQTPRASPGAGPSGTDVVAFSLGHHHTAALRAEVDRDWAEKIFLPYDKLLANGRVVHGTRRTR